MEDLLFNADLIFVAALSRTFPAGMDKSMSKSMLTPRGVWGKTIPQNPIDYLDSI